MLGALSIYNEVQRQLRTLKQYKLHSQNMYTQSHLENLLTNNDVTRVELRTAEL